ncbi:hypothetical protein [Stenotrophomonas sp. SY1]|uniref:hypothetical protein n=1 Tax=Stenotrophomonas sp. SY1 TaxID=477235 RepID=UPI001E48E17E|nr:hypothetical protein [Stenotrophomonas sp. SY1]MCD9088139.1 hypothetical protein [Stenotrophomonas sp. SY1]
MATPPRKTGSMPAGKTSSSSISGSHLQQRNLSRERMAEDMAAFSSAGGKIEVLGNTPFRTKPSPEKPAAASDKTSNASGSQADKGRSHKRQG